MNLQLTSDDGRTVDLLLDHAATAKGNGNGQVYSVSDPSLGERVTRVSKLLHLLDAIPAFEPPDDLAARTLEYVESADQRQPVAPVVPSLFGEQRPVI